MRQPQTDSTVMEMKNRKYILRTWLSFMLPMFAGGHGAGPLGLFQIAMISEVAFAPSTAGVVTSSLLAGGQGLLMSGLFVSNETVVNWLCRLAVALLWMALVMIVLMMKANIWILTFVTSWPFLYYSGVVMLFGAVEED